MYKFPHTSKTKRKKKKEKKNWDQTNLGTYVLLAYIEMHDIDLYSEYTSFKIKFLFRSVTMRDLGDHKFQHQILGISF